ncbi:MAG: Gp138 family membrane-puncturing spike protein [bacterium]
MRINGKFVVAPTLAEVFELHADDVGSKLRVCMPGYIKTYDAAKHTASVVIGENFVLNDGTVLTVPAPLLDVPVLTLQGGGLHLGLPVKASDTSPDGKGDECLVVFADFNIDAWHAAGGQQTPPDKRQHDISDGFAIVGPNSIANALPTALEGREGGLATALAKVAIDADTDLVTIQGGTGESLGPILTDLLTILTDLNTGIQADAAVIPNAAAAAVTASAQLALLQARLEALLY